MTKPDELPEWDTTQVNSIEPDAAHKAQGWLAPGGIPEKPPFQTFNYWQNEVFRWLEHFDAVFSAGSLIGGLILSNAADPNHDVTFSAGVAVDSTGTRNLLLSSALTKKITASWVAGNNVGGLFSGTVAANTWYHAFIIEKDSDGSIDVGFDISISAANIPSGYTAFRRVGSIFTDGSADILGFSALELAGGAVDYTWEDQLIDVGLASLPNTSRNLVVMSAPLGIETFIKIRSAIAVSIPGASFTWVGSIAVTDFAPGATNYTHQTAADSTISILEQIIQTNTASQIAYRGGGTGVTLNIKTIGFLDRRVD